MYILQILETSIIYHVITTLYVPSAQEFYYIIKQQLVRERTQFSSSCSILLNYFILSGRA